MKVSAVLGGLMLVLACTSQEEQAPQSYDPAAMPGAVATQAAPVGTAAQLAAAAGDSVLYLDVRTPEEFRTGHVQGAVLLPHDQMEQRWQELAAWQDKPVVVYCRTGRRSGLAIDVLRAKGFTQLTNGVNTEQMASRGLPIVTEE